MWSEILKLVISLVICFAAGFIGAIFTGRSVRDWYSDLVKPRFTPPDAAFGPVWSTLYIFMAVSLFLVWRQGFDTPGVPVAFILFWVQLTLNSLWSYLFFGKRSPAPALLEISVLWMAILITLILFMRLSLIAGLLMLPYLLWVSVATYLNAGIWLLNKKQRS